MIKFANTHPVLFIIIILVIIYGIYGGASIIFGEIMSGSSSVSGSSGGGGTSYDANTIRCKYCDRKYDEDSNNGKNIRKTNLCLNCYNNMKSAQNAIKEMPR